jgi:hypothetical protein
MAPMTPATALDMPPVRAHAASCLWNGGSSIEYLEDYRIPMPWCEVELELVIHELVMQDCWGLNAAGWTRHDANIQLQRQDLEFVERISRPTCTYPCRNRKT